MSHGTLVSMMSRVFIDQLVRVETTGVRHGAVQGDAATLLVTSTRVWLVWCVQPSPFYGWLQSFSGYLIRSP